MKENNFIAMNGNNLNEILAFENNYYIFFKYNLDLIIL